MAAATTLALLALSAAKTTSTYLDQRKAAKAADAQGAYEGAAYDQNAGLADLQSADVLTRGTEAENAVRRQGNQLRGSQRAAFAGQGVTLDEGSAADVQASDSALSMLDQLHIRNNARREAWGYRVQANDYRNQGRLARTAGANAAASYRGQSVGTLLSGAGELANIYSAAPKPPRKG